MLKPSVLFRRIATVTCAGLFSATGLMVITGCASTDYVRVAAESVERASEYETPSDFFAPSMARVLGEPAPKIRAQAKHHYLQVIYNLGGLSVATEQSLEQQGLLGEAFVLKTLAQWRLGRISDARSSSLRAKASGQEALSAEHRALFVAFDGIVQLEGALDALEEGKSYTEIVPGIAGEGGAWKMFGAARTEAGRGDPIQVDLMKARLAAFVVLKRSRENEPVENLANPDETWDRLVAEVAIELRDLATHPTPNRAAHRKLVAEWAALCGRPPPAM